MKGAETANCKRCKETPVPSNYGSPRKCAFNDAGVFTEDNWACVTALLLRDFMDSDDSTSGESLSVRRDDQSYGALYVPPHPDDIGGYGKQDRMGAFRGGGFIAATWYKSRGQTEVMVRVDAWNSENRMKCAMPLMAEEAEEALANLELARGASSEPSEGRG